MIKNLISIVVPCYNQAQYLDEALDSVMGQDHDEWECIIVNDGSTDDTAVVAGRWITKDRRFSYVEQENKGLSSARNLGIEKASGTYILPLDADDRISASYTRLAVEALDRNSYLKVVYSKAEYMGDKTGTWHLGKYDFINLLRKNMIFCSAIFAKAEWKRIGGYDINMKYGLEDWEFWIHLLKGGGDVLRLDSVHFYYRIKSDSMIRKMNPEQVDYSETYVFNKHRDAFLKSYDSLLDEKRKLHANLRSRKFITNRFFERFFGFRIFKDRLK